MIKSYTQILPFWPLKTSLNENYFFLPTLAANKINIKSKIFISSNSSSSETLNGIVMEKLSFTKIIFKILNTEGIIHFQTSQKNVFALLLITALFKKKTQTIIWTPHISFGYGNPSNLKINIYKIFQKILKKINLIIAISPFETTYLKKLNYRHLNYLPLPIDFNNLSKIDINKSKQTNLLFIGGDRPIKGLEVLLKNIKPFLQENQNVKLHIIGEVNSKIKKSYKITNILFQNQLKPLSNKFINLLKICSIYINNSLFEGCPLAVHEVAAAKIALCLPNLPTLKSIFQKNALYHDPKNPIQLIKNIEFYIKTPKIKTDHIIQNLKIIENTSTKKFINNFQKVLELYYLN